MLSVIDVGWIETAQTGIAKEFNDNGGWWELKGGWRIECGPADFEPCGSVFEKVRSWSCMARPGHEHPHITSQTYHPFWRSNRIVCVSRRSLTNVKT